MAMSSTSVLSPQQLESWHDDGFLVIEQALSPEACEQLRRQALMLVDSFEPAENATVFDTNDQSHAADDYFLSSGDKIRFFLEDGALDDSARLTRPKAQSINKIGHAMHDLDDVFASFSRQDPLGQICTDIGFSDPLLLQSMYIFKSPEIGGEVSWHTDHTFLWTEPQSVVGMWVAIDDATVDNGCMWAVPGGHLEPPRFRFRRDGRGGTTMEELSSEPWNTDSAVPIEAEQGTLVLLHGTLPHGSGPNTSDKSRHAYTVHVIDAGADYPDDNWLQRPTSLPLSGFQTA